MNRKGGDPVAEKNTSPMTVDLAKKLLKDENVYLTEEAKRMLQQMVNK